MSDKPLHKNMKETEIAFILLQGNRTMSIKELVQQIIEVKGISTTDTARAMARIYTSLTQDTRFSFKGNGQWGLRDWKGEMPRKNEPDLLPSEKHYQPKAEDYIWDDEAEDEDEEKEEEQEIIEPPEA
jgi:DNA-directed RNA polymerase delta subunit